MSRYKLTFALALFASAPLNAAPIFGTHGGIGSSTSTYSAGEPVGGSYNINGLTGAITTQGLTTLPVDVTGTTVGAIYSAGRPIFSYYPSVGNDPGDHQRGQQLIRFNAAQDASISEVGLAIDGTTNTGYAKAYANSVAYAVGDLIDVNASIYKVTSPGTSSPTGSGPTGTTPGTPITDGNMQVQWQCHDQCNAKMSVFISHIAGSGAGHVWGQVTDLALNPGYAGGFSTTAEFDQTNNSGTAQPGSNIVYLTGDAGSFPTYNGLSIYTPSNSGFLTYNGFNTAGAHSVQHADVNLSTSATYAVNDSGIHAAGIRLSGAYSVAPLDIATDYPTAFLLETGNSANLNKWRATSTLQGTSDGYLTFQHTNDGFGANFVNTITLAPSGFVGIGKTAPIFQLDVGGDVNAAHFVSGGTVGVSCAAGTVNLSTFAVTNGIVTHC